MQKVIIRVALILVGVLLASSIAGTMLLRGSLPALDGRVRARGVLSTTTVERDAAGVVTVTGSSRPDVAFGLAGVAGFL